MSLLLGYNTNGFAHHDLLDALDVLAGIGYRSVGLTIDVHHAHPDRTDFARLGEELRSRHLVPLIETGTRYLLDPKRKHYPSLLTKGAGRLRRDFYFRCLDIASAVGAPAISIWSGRDEGEDAWRRLLEPLELVCERAHAVGLEVAFEPEPGMFIDTMAQFDELRRRLPHPALRLTLDVGHLHCLEEGAPELWIDRYASLLANVHLDDHRRGVHDHLFFGEGEIDFVPVLGALRRAAAGRPLVATVELSRHSHAAVETAQRAYSFLAGLT